jgi:hypothetical protein
VDWTRLRLFFGIWGGEIKNRRTGTHYRSKMNWRENISPGIFCMHYSGSSTRAENDKVPGSNKPVRRAWWRVGLGLVWSWPH